MSGGILPHWLPKGGAAKVLGLVVTLSAGAVAYSHYAQVAEKAVMRAGVERDKERLRQKRLRRQQEEANQGKKE